MNTYADLMLQLLMHSLLLVSVTMYSQFVSQFVYTAVYINSKWKRNEKNKEKNICIKSVLRYST